MINKYSKPTYEVCAQNTQENVKEKKSTIMEN